MLPWFLLYLAAVMVKKIIRYFLLFICILLGLVLLIVSLIVIPVNRYDYRKEPFYGTMMSRLDSLRGARSVPEVSEGFSVGYAAVNLTPPFRTSTAGYGNRKGKPYSAVHDSVYVRTLVIDNGGKRVAIVSADLLIMPPTVTAILNETLAGTGFDLNNTYLGATHTHNGIGNWGTGVATFLYGPYKDSVVQFIAQCIRKSIVEAQERMLPATLKAGAIAVDNAVRNRIENTASVDSLLRVVEVHRSDSSKLLLMSYTAHATCLFSRDLELSRDYPGTLVDAAEAQGYTFAMFIAGAVGSHGCNAPEYGWTCMDWMTDQILTEFNKQRHTLRPVLGSSLAMARVPMELGEMQARVLEGWRLRPWVFRAAFGDSPNYLTALRVGDLVFLGTPCDFSGQLMPPIDSVARQRHVQTFVTSFNGGYIGYITKDVYYDRNHHETRLMNWYGPGNGAYFTECLEKMIDVVGQ